MFSAGNNAFYTTFTAGTQTANATYTLPTAMATANSQALLGSTTGVLSWGTDFGANNITTTGTLGAGATTLTGVTKAGNATNYWQMDTETFGGTIYPRLQAIAAGAGNYGVSRGGLLILPSALDTTVSYFGLFDNTYTTGHYMSYVPGTDGAWLFESNAINPYADFGFPVSSVSYFAVSGNPITDTSLPASGDFRMSGTFNKIIGQGRRITGPPGAGSLTINSGGAKLLTTNNAGGSLILSAGISTGTGISSILFQTATAGTSGTEDNTPTTKLTLSGSLATFALPVLLPAGTATAGTAPLKFTSGTLTTVAVAGQVEYLSGLFYIRGTEGLAFGAATEYINSANAGYLDLNAATGIRLNSAVNLGANTLTTTGKITIAYSAGAPTLTTDGDMSIAYVNPDNRIYFYSNGGQHYVTATAGFEVPNFETIDPISGDQMKVNDIVLGKLDSNVSDGALHGVWVKWDSVKKDLMNEVRQNISLEDLEKSTKFESEKNVIFISWVKSAFESFGILINDGIANIKEIVVDKITAKAIVIDNLEADKARLKKLEMVDSVTGEIYCTWIENGEWKRTKGDCLSITIIDEQIPTPTPTPDPISTPIESPIPEPTPTPDPISTPIESPIPEPTPTPDPISTPIESPIPEPTPTETSIPETLGVIETPTPGIEQLTPEPVQAAPAE
jgi:hypothetical protein